MMMTIKQLFREILRIVLFIIIAFVLSFTIVNVCFSQTTFLNEGFENTDSLPAGWTMYDEDGDGYAWTNQVFTVGAHSGDHVLLSPTSQTATGVPSNNWLITPVVDLTSNAILSFWTRSDRFSGLLEDMNILISTTGNTPADFTIVLDSIRDIPQEYTQYTIDLHAYTGQQIYIAFQVISMNKQTLALDDIDISGNGDVWPEIAITAPVNKERFPLYDTVLIALNPTVSVGTIDSVLLYIDDSLRHTFTTDTFYQYEWITDEFCPVAYYDIKAIAYNNHGHSASDEIEVRLFDIYPVCDLVHPSSEANIFAGTTIPIIAEASDIDTSGYKKGIINVYFYINDSLHYIDSDFPYCYNWNTDGYTVGQYKVEVIAFDNHGNRNSINQIMYTYLIDQYTDDKIEWNNIYENVSDGVRFFVDDYVSTELSSSVIQVKDSSFVVVGISDASNDGQTGYLLKISNSGDTLWTRFYNISDNCAESFSSVAETFDVNGNSTGLIALGLIDESACTISSDFLLVKTDVDGIMEWAKTFAPSIATQNESMAVKQTKDGGYIVAGYQGVPNKGIPNSMVASNAWLIKLDADGNEEWNKTYGDDKYYDFASDVIQTSDGGFVFTGYTNTYSNLPDSGFADAWFCKLDKDGNEEWNKMYGGDMTEVMYSIDEVPNNGFIAAGLSMSISGDSIREGWVLRLNSSGDTLWTKGYGGDLHDKIKSIKCTHGNNFIACGLTQLEFAPGLTHNDAWIFKIDANGDVIWDEHYGGTAGDEMQSVVPTFDKGYILTGNTISFGMGSGHDFGFGVSIWVIKIKQDEFESIEENGSNNNIAMLSSYPNPCSNGSYIVIENDAVETVNLTVWNSDGKLITTLYDGNMPAGKNTIYFDTQNLENGLYFYKFQTEKGIVTKKLIKL